MNELVKSAKKKAPVAAKKASKPKAIKPTKIEKKESDILIDTIIDAIDDIKGEHIVLIDISKIEDSMTDYFIIAEAESGVQVKSIGENVTRRVRNELHERPINKEGFENGEWILLDYVNVVVHIFKRDRRAFYKIEDLWSDGILHHKSK
jgi:ribosome-associated protein